MPIPDEKRLQEFIKEHGPFRLGCVECSRDDFDGVKELPTDWQDIQERQSLKQALSTYDEEAEEPPGYSVMDWETHIGLCPKCQ